MSLLINRTIAFEYLDSEETSLTKVSVRNDGVLEIRFKQDEYQVEAQDQIDIHDAVARLTNNGKVAYHVLVIPGLYGGVSKEAREMEMFERVGFQNQNSLAIVVHSFPQRLFGKLYISLKKNKPKYPTNLFDSEEMAMKWISKNKGIQSPAV